MPEPRCLSIASQSLSKFTRNRVTQWWAKLGRRGPTYPKGGQSKGLWLRVAMGSGLGVSYSRLERGPVTTTGRCAEHKKCGSFHVAENQHPGWGELRDTIKQLYITISGRPVLFPLRRRTLGEDAVQASENLVLRHER